MRVNRRQFLSNAAVTAAVMKIPPQDWMLAQEAPSGAAPTDKSYGSGYFGKWIEDEFGLPAFHYTCDQSTDPKAVTQMNPGVLTSTEHIFQIGNDRLVALASNYGHLRVRQDEGAPKFLNDYAPDHAPQSAAFFVARRVRSCLGEELARAGIEACGEGRGSHRGLDGNRRGDRQGVR